MKTGYLRRRVIEINSNKIPTLEEIGIKTYSLEEIGEVLKDKKVIMVTGHRPDKLWGYNYNSYNQPKEYQRLREKIKEVIEASKAQVAISGMALGVDTIFTQECIKLSQIEKIIAAIPCYGQESIWRNESKKVYYELLKNEKVMPYYVAKEYYNNNKSLLNHRNKWMVEQTRRYGGTVLAIWNGSEGGTGNCVQCAKEHGISPIIIDPREIESELSEMSQKEDSKVNTTPKRTKIKGSDL